MIRSRNRKTRSRRRTRKRGFGYLLRRRLGIRRRPKKELKPSDLRRRNQIRRRNALVIKLSLVFVLVIGLIVGVWYLARLERFLIQKIDVRGAEVVKEEEVRALVFSEIEGNIGLLFPKKNSFFVPVKKIEKELKESSVVINRTNILRKGLDELIVVIQERQPAMIFCEDLGGSVGECYFADSGGILYRPVPHIARSQFRTIYFESKGGESLLGESLLSERETEALFVLIDVLADKGDIETEGVVLIPEEYFRINTGEGYAVLVPIKGDYTNEVSRLFTALQADIFKEDVSLDSVNEFDLRFGRKVFYRFDES